MLHPFHIEKLSMWIHDRKCSVEQYCTDFVIFHHDLRYKIKLDFLQLNQWRKNEIIDSPKVKYRSYLLSEKPRDLQSCQL